MTQPTPGAVPRKSQATTALVLGILSFVCCQLLAPVAWYLGDQEVKAIDRGEGRIEDRGTATAGKILGIVGTVLLGLGIIFGILWLVGIFAFGVTSS